jgi:hypothetical protein
MPGFPVRHNPQRLAEILLMEAADPAVGIRIPVVTPDL